MTPAALLVVALAFPGDVASPATPRPDSVSERKDDWLARSPLERIAAPGGATLKDGGGGSGGDHDEWRIHVLTQHSESAVLDYYASELERLGFALHPKVVEESVAMRTGNHVGPDGTKWHVLLLASRGVQVDTEQVHLTLRLTRLAED